MAINETNMYFTHSSRKACSIINQFDSGKTIKAGIQPINPNDIANRIVKMSLAPSDKTYCLSIFIVVDITKITKPIIAAKNDIHFHNHKLQYTLFFYLINIE